MIARVCRGAFAITLFVCLFSHAAHPAKTTLSENDVLRSAAASFPGITASKQDVSSAAADTLSANGGFDINWRTRASGFGEGYYLNRRLDTVIEKPTSVWGTSFFAGYRLGAGEFPVYDGKLDTQSGGEIRAGIELPLLRNGPVDRRRANLWRAEAGEKAAKYSLDTQVIDVTRTASQRYWDWLAAEHKLRITEDLLGYALDRDEQIKKRATHGDIPRIEMDENARAILQRRSQAVSARRSRDQMALELSLYLRDSNGRPRLPTPEEAPEHFPPAILPPQVKDTLETLTGQAQKSRPDVVRIAVLQEQNDVEFRWARNQVLPRLDALVTVSKDLGRPEKTMQPTELEGALVLEIPLQIRTASGRMDAANANRLKLEAQERLAKDRVANEVRDAIIAMRAAHERVALTAQEVAVALKLQKAELIRFRNGDSSLLFVNIREQATADARLKEVEALQDHFKALASYHAAMGEARRF